MAQLVFPLLPLPMFPLAALLAQHAEAELIGVAVACFLLQDVEFGFLLVEVAGAQAVVFVFFEEAPFCAGGGLGAFFVGTPGDGVAHGGHDVVDLWFVGG